MGPKVSIIIPNFNHARYLEERLASIINQTFKDFELIVLDDCSIDDSVEVIQNFLGEFPYRLIVNQANSGSTFAQWDRGIEIATGDLIWIAESDDVAAPQFLENLVAMLEDKSVAMAYCQSLAIDEHSSVTANLKGWTDIISSHLWRNDFILDGTYFAINFLAIKNVIPNASAVVFRREHYISPYRIKPDYKLSGDLILYANIINGRRIAFCAEPLNYYRFHPSTVRKSRSASYLTECSRISEWILATTDAWKQPGDLVLLREHLANLWFTIGLEPASIQSWLNHWRAYQLLYRLHGPYLAMIIICRLPQSLWRISIPYRIWWQLGTQSRVRKVKRKLGTSKN